jgi:hypothetical protein
MKALLTIVLVFAFNIALFAGMVWLAANIIKGVFGS